jgi:hypothetical protein
MGDPDPALERIGWRARRVRRSGREPDPAQGDKAREPQCLSAIE